MEYNLNKRQRSLCAQIRSGTLPLALETGRFNANTFTFLFYCTKYDDIREMSSICEDFLDLNDYEKMELCFDKGTFAVSDFICQAWERRQCTLYNSV